MTDSLTVAARSSSGAPGGRLVPQCQPRGRASRSSIHRSCRSATRRPPLGLSCGAYAERHRQLRLRQIARSALHHARRGPRRQRTPSPSPRWRRGSTSSPPAARGCCGCRRHGRCGTDSAGPLLVVISTSRSPSLSKSPNAAPRATFGCANPPPTSPATSRNPPPPSFRNRCGGCAYADVVRHRREPSRRCGRSRPAGRAARPDRHRRRSSRSPSVRRDRAPDLRCAAPRRCTARRRRGWYSADHLVVEVGDGQAGDARSCRNRPRRRPCRRAPCRPR